MSIPYHYDSDERNPLCFTHRSSGTITNGGQIKLSRDIALGEG